MDVLELDCISLDNAVGKMKDGASTTVNATVNISKGMVVGWSNALPLSEKVINDNHQLIIY